MMAKGIAQLDRIESRCSEQHPEATRLIRAAKAKLDLSLDNNQPEREKSLQLWDPGCSNLTDAQLPSDIPRMFDENLEFLGLLPNPIMKPLRVKRMEGAFYSSELLNKLIKLKISRKQKGPKTVNEIIDIEHLRAKRKGVLTTVTEYPHFLLN